MRNGTTVTAVIDRHPIGIRPSDSDAAVALQIFGAREYDLGPIWSRINALAGSWKTAGETPVILDIGANVGYSALYFADMVPEAMVVAVEADATTYEALTANVSGHDRIRTIHAAVWSHERGVRFETPMLYGSWAGKVKGETGDTPSLLLGSTYAGIPGARPVVIKLDVEGAEREICEAAADIIREAPVILIEPHDFMLPGAGCLSPLYEILSGCKVDTLIKGENLIFIKSELMASA